MSDLTGLDTLSANGKQAEKVPLLQEIGTSGTPIYAGRVADEFLPLLRGDLGRKVFREMSDDSAIIGGFLYSIEQQLRAVRWEWEPAEGDTSDEYADHFNECMADMSQSWAETLSGIVRGEMVYGWALNELVYKKRLGPDQRDPAKRSKYNDGRVGWRKWALRTQETRLRWETDPDDGNDVMGMWQLAPPSWVAKYIPLERALLFRTTSARGNPEGRSVLRNAVSSWFYMKHIQRIEGIGIERDLAGLPMMRIPAAWMGGNAPDGADQFVATATAVVQGIRRDEQEGLLLPSFKDEHGDESVTLELLSTGGTRQFDTDKIIGRYSQHIAMTVLQDFLLLGHEQVGSYNAAASKIDLATLALQTFADGIGAVASTHAGPRLMGLNGWDKSLSPQFKPGKIAKPDLGLLGAFIKAIADGGAQLFGDPQNDPLRAALLRAADMPDDPPIVVAEPDPTLPAGTDPDSDDTGEVG